MHTATYASAIRESSSVRDAEFKNWLEERGANTEAGRNTRAHAVRSIENNLADLGSPHADLETA
jgi:5-methylcytosine-specific restriction enzyme B